MSFDRNQFEQLIRDSLSVISMKVPVADGAVNLLLGTAAQESHFGTYLRQLGDGPAEGVFQMEPPTERDIWRNFIVYDSELQGLMRSIRAFHGATDQLEWDLRYATIMARLHYYRRPEPLPEHDDIEGLARYWKDHYNTHLGAGTVEEFIENYERYVA